MALRTRKPTGAAPFPFILLEGPEKAGKSYLLRKLSASPKVGRTFVFDLGEVPSDEYATLGRYEIVEHNGTYADVWDQLREAMAVPSDPARPNVIGLDTGTALWELLCDWANARARRSKKAQRALEADPDAEIDTPMNLWNDAKDRWWQVVRALQAWPGIVVLVARAQEVAKVVGGVPVAGETDYSVKVEKGTPFAVTAQVRMKRTPRTAQLVACSSLNVDMADGQPIALPLEGALEHLVFELLGAGTEPFTASLVVGEAGLTAGEAKRALFDLARRTEPEAKARDLGAKVWAECGFEGRKDGFTAAELEAATALLVALLKGETPPDPPPASPSPFGGEGAPATAGSVTGQGAPPAADQHPDDGTGDLPAFGDDDGLERGADTGARCAGCTFAIGDQDSTLELHGAVYHAGCEPF